MSNDDLLKLLIPVITSLIAIISSLVSLITGSTKPSKKAVEAQISTVDEKQNEKIVKLEKDVISIQEKINQLNHDIQSAQEATSKLDIEFNKSYRMLQDALTQIMSDVGEIKGRLSHENK